MFSEAPVCMKHDTINRLSTIASPLNLNQCLVSNVTMPAGIVNDVNLKNLRINISNVGALTVYLNSPSGTRIKLFDGLCNGQPNVNVTLDETRGLLNAPSINTAP